MNQYCLRIARDRIGSEYAGLGMRDEVFQWMESQMGRDDWIFSRVDDTTDEAVFYFRLPEQAVAMKMRWG